MTTMLTDKDLETILRKAKSAAASAKGRDFADKWELHKISSAALRIATGMILERAIEEIDAETVKSIDQRIPGNYSAGLAFSTGIVRALIPEQDKA